MIVIRDIKSKEKVIIEFMLSKVGSPWKSIDIPTKIRTMNDGGMGSISFDIDGKQLYGKDLIQFSYTDTNDIIVLITLTIDKHNNLFELDFWKTDFSKLKKYPKPTDLTKTIINND